MPRKLYIAFIWNQHQPYYKDTLTNEFIMPWTRLHATKDYYQMAALLEEYPRIKQTFNLTPSLLLQLEEYISDSAQDNYQKAMKPSQQLTLEDKMFILTHYFDIQWEKVIEKHYYYKRLLEMQGRVGSRGDITSALERYTLQDYLDLQVWFNMVWISPRIRLEDPYLRSLQEKGRNFIEKDKEKVVNKQKEIMEQVIPIHARLQQKGQIELITTPFYHPILPLIIDSHSALRSSPGLPLPDRYTFKEDAAAQLEQAKEQFKQYFKVEPKGVWPPEQAVSPEVVPLFNDLNFSWTVSDEQILASSLQGEIYRDGYGHVLNPETLYQPYLITYQGAEINMIFRDHHLSDRIGFEYQHMRGKDAAEDLIHRFHKIKENLKDAPGNYLVTIALDGENAWEWYPADKEEFLHHLYGRLQQDSELETVTVSDFLAQNPPRRHLRNLSTGSWVDHALTRWIGTEKKNALWNILLKARQKIAVLEEKEGKSPRVRKALQNIYMAEGSDYTWWVDSMPYYLAAPFEALFRKHIVNVYHHLEEEVPPELMRSVLTNKQKGFFKGKAHLSGPVAMVHSFQSEKS
ncbi:MAG: glycoside hydrolase [Firmicutes bacterium]|nr:glycoside hydrolase [Bacillota bacterium]